LKKGENFDPTLTLIKPSNIFLKKIFGQPMFPPKIHLVVSKFGPQFGKLYGQPKTRDKNEN
jgi:hypothetical protein